MPTSGSCEFSVVENLKTRNKIGKIIARHSEMTGKFEIIWHNLRKWHVNARIHHRPLLRSFPMVSESPQIKFIISTTNDHVCRKLLYFFRLSQKPARTNYEQTKHRRNKKTGTATDWLGLNYGYGTQFVHSIMSMIGIHHFPIRSLPVYA